MNDSRSDACMQLKKLRLNLKTKFRGFGRDSIWFDLIRFDLIWFDLISYVGISLPQFIYDLSYILCHLIYELYGVLTAPNIWGLGSSIG